MAATSDTELTLPEEYVGKLRALRGHPHSVLLEGPVAATEATLALLLGMDSTAPVVEIGSETRDHLTMTSGTIILRNAGALCRADQQRLLEALGSARGRKRVISTCEQPLFARVQAGLFDAGLYYRLNLVLLRLDSPDLGC